MSNPTILIVDDERTLARAMKAFLAERGYEAEIAGDVATALQCLSAVRPDVVVTDVRLPDGSGIDVLRRVREFDPAISVVVMTAYGSIEEAVEAVKLGAFDYIKKPVDLEELKLLADRARETSLLKQELSYHRQRAMRDVPLSGLLGTSPAIRSVLEQAHEIATMAETPPVLITGETGTGKGLLAHAIHAASRDAARPFIEVNCTALPGPLIEAELFGYERGAFTDAKESKIGLFEAAEGGFLFLDEVGDIELSLQGKLLRAIEERVVRRVGGIRDRKIGVRIIVATNRDLEREVQRDRFRKDLFFRLAVLPLHLPPLRERGEDILLLAAHFLRQFTAKYGREAKEITPAARGLLRAYPWPGNVRELSHVIERAVLWSRGPMLGPEHLSLLSSADTAEPTAPASQPLPPTGDLEQWERSMIESALHEAGGNQTRAAQRLGISRDTLRYRLKKFGLAG